MNFDGIKAGAKRGARGLVATAARLSGLTASVERRNGQSLTILCYHRVLPAEQRAAYHDPDLVVTPEVFAEHCRVLARYYDVAPLAQSLAAWQAAAPATRPRAAITFDDGYVDNARYAVPILADFGLRATFYIVAGLVGTESQTWYDRAGRALVSLGRDARAEVGQAKAMTPQARMEWVDALEKQAGSSRPAAVDRIMDDAALRALVAGGHEIGSHTMTHPLLPQLWAAELDFEIARSRSVLAKAANTAIVGFSYPNGDSTQTIQQLTEQAGYSYAVSADPGVNNLQDLQIMALKRWFISQDRLVDASGRASGDLLRMEISGLSRRLLGRTA
ncbi:hypothetical protein VW29_16635 [Devosia limi DSM 17137]|uniref:Chitooligosaccharide deacetylase n=1 Tax=Devosia limi DSM 17137 TaxID=1121477 RepID=A0A0F5LED8_9HYPH|nr:polysaccharide deacetylase family protein [Devosia limi]KKB80635.1 hypothetical protein VW29_16635 [Devosia limi DSM 17137]SHE50100.1 Polysaccharide deacetylase [Devosia limi DSM 17137]